MQTIMWVVWKQLVDLPGSSRSPLKYARVPCSKNDALRLLRKLVVVKVLTEETYRQDNQYGGVLSYLAASDAAARALTQGSLKIRMPFAVSDQLPHEHSCGQEVNGVTTPCMSSGSL